MGSAFSGSNNGVGDVDTLPGPPQINRAVPGATQLTWDSAQQKFIMAPVTSSIATGCWDIPSASYKPWAAGCNNQVLYTSDGVLPAVGVSVGPPQVNLQIPTNSGPTYVTPLTTTGGVPASSPVTQSIASTPSGDIMFGSFDATAFVTTNWMWLAGGAAVLAFLAMKK